MLNYFLIATATPIFKESPTISGSYVGYVFLVLIALLAVYVGILLLLKKFKIINTYGSKANKKGVTIIQRARLNQTLTMVHYEYLGKQYMLLDNGKHILDISHQLEPTKEQ